MRKHTKKQDEKFIQGAIKLLLSHGAVKVEDRCSKAAYEIGNEDLGTFTFFLFGPNEGHVFSIFCRLNEVDRIKETAQIVNRKFGLGVHEPMNPFSGKFNIHEYKAEEVFSELDKRLEWITSYKKEI